MENRNSGKNSSNGNKRPRLNFNLYWIYALIAIIFIGMQIFSSFNSALKEINKNEFIEMMKDLDVKQITIVNNEFAEITISPDRLEKEKYKDVRQRSFGGENLGPHYRYNIGSPQLFDTEIKDLWAQYPETKNVEIRNETRKNLFGDLLSWLIPIGLMVLVWIFIMRRMSGGPAGGQIFNIGKSKAKLFDKDTNVLVTFDNVAGLDEAKVELKEIVDFLKNPKKYTDLGAKIPKGALLVGPPGTGKTLLAKAIAGEAKVPFFSLSGSDFVEMFVGVGASRVRDLFRQAKEKAPAIIFIDEIDAIGRARGRSIAQGANDERENTLNQLLTEMDGFEANTGIIILAATNRADILDKALLRPGRFDRQIYIDLPDLNGRKEIFKVHMKPLKKLDKSVDIDLLAKQTPGFSGADIANVCNEAALIAARKNKQSITREDFNDAIDRVIGGLEKKNKVIAPKEKKTIAYHEAGHATVSWLLEHASPLVKVTIIPRGQSLGAAWYLPEERQITTKDQLIDEICAALGGRAAEQVEFGKVSTGALSDLEKVTKQAYAMVSIYGLNERIGNLSYYDSTGQSDYAFTKPYSEKTAEIIDEEVKKLVEDCYARAVRILSENKDKLDILANRLLEREILYREDLVEIFGERPWGENTNDISVKPEEPTVTNQPVSPVIPENPSA
ncbi:MAG: ATP-dependent zinc metalloprotease FtsH [Flavobacteriales bacterium]|nr:ATP-dependent zinc metalloprotease FtsH [Flavobacteriales bacterium]